jgi:hypothetical protein
MPFNVYNCQLILSGKLCHPDAYHLFVRILAASSCSCSPSVLPCRGGPVLLKSHGLLINSTSVNFWCREIMHHVNTATRVYCRNMSVLFKELWAYHTKASHCHNLRVKKALMKLRGIASDQ